MDVLKAVTQWLSWKQHTQSAKIRKEAEKHIKQLKDGETAEVLEENDDFEILELADSEEVVSSSADVSWVKKKLRPNDKITVKYTDGRVESDVKYKKVKADIESGDAEIV